MSTLAYPHVAIGANGKPYIDGTAFKVRMLVEEYLAGGVDAIELQRRHPQLSLAQVYGALTYYHDHKPEFDRELAELDQAEQDLRPRLENSATTEKLRQAMQERG